jgi:hypothetical protein
MKLSRISTTVIVFCLLTFGVVFWPTLYRYDHVTLAGGTLPLRTQRITGRTEIFSPTAGWFELGTSRSNDDVALPLPSPELRQLTGNGELTGHGSFLGKVYNGSSWTVTELTLRLVALERDGNTRWERLFNAAVRIKPFSTESISIEVTGDINVSSTKWSIIAGRGLAPK